MGSNAQPQRQIWRIKTVQEKTELARSTIYLLAQKGEFPKPHKLGSRAVGWDSLEVQQWIDNRLSGGAA